jgi:MerR family transcriptional regulator, light-induced transcriptional regulator
MNDRTSLSLATVSIAAVERDTGLSKDTLRVWERRYGFPQPGRDAFGERAYPLAQLDKLRVVRRLMDAGHRPGRIVGLPVEQLQQLSAPASSAHEQALVVLERDDLLVYFEHIKNHRLEELRRSLSQTLLRIGLERFVVDVVAPLNAMVGDAWARGKLEVFEEHFYTEAIQAMLRQAIGSITQPSQAPRVLLTTFPLESHGLGLLMAQVLLALDGARCVPLGVQTPIVDIALAAQSQNIDIVALSFSASLNPNYVLDGLVDLRSKLPERTQIWAGGNCPILQRRPPTGIQVMSRLQDIHAAMVNWGKLNEHAQHSGKPV